LLFDGWEVGVIETRRSTWFSALHQTVITLQKAIPADFSAFQAVKRRQMIISVGLNF